LEVPLPQAAGPEEGPKDLGQQIPVQRARGGAAVMYQQLAHPEAQAQQGAEQAAVLVARVLAPQAQVPVPLLLAPRGSAVEAALLRAKVHQAPASM